MLSPDQLHDAELRELYDYWLSKCQDGGLPARRDIDAVEIPRLLRHLALLEVVGDAEDFVFVLAGGRIEEVHGRSLRGVRLGDLQKAFEKTPSADSYVAAVRSRASSDGERVDSLLMGAVFRSVGEPGYDAWLDP